MSDELYEPVVFEFEGGFSEANGQTAALESELTHKRLFSFISMGWI